MYRMFQSDSEKISLMGLITVVFLFMLRSVRFIWFQLGGVESKTKRFMLTQKLLLTQEKHWDETINLYFSQPKCEIHTDNNVSSQTACVHKSRSSFASPHTARRTAWSYKSEVLTTILIWLYLNISKYPMRQSAWLGLPFSVRLNM